MPEQSPEHVPIFIVDDDDAFRSSLISLLHAHGYESQGFASVDSFTDELPQRPPGVLLLDLRMPELGGLAFLEGNDALRRFGVIVISGHGDLDAAVRAVQAGALGFVEKPFAAEELLEKVDGTIAIVRTRVIEDRQTSEIHSRIQSLTPRELQILQAMIEGGSNKSIARKLDISARTVEMHRSHMMRKLGVRSTGEAVHLATIAGVSRTE